MSQPVSQSVLSSLMSASQEVYLSLTDILTFINDSFRFRIYKNIRKMDSTYITENGYNGPTSQQSDSQSVSQSVLDRQTGFSHKPVSLSLTDRLTCINDLFTFRRYRIIINMDSTYHGV